MAAIDASGIDGLAASTSSQGPATSPSTFKMTDGWYVAIACGFGIVTANTRIAPVSFGILGLALIYQLTLLVQGK
jgi:hypothetical protein